MRDILIIGAGPAGLCAALYGARCGLFVTVLEAQTIGGQMGTTPFIENYPGFAKISGEELSSNMLDTIKNENVELIYDKAEKIEKTNDGFAVYTINGKLTAKTVIIANGAKRRTLQCIGEEKFIGKGISWCAVCDGNFFKGKRVAVIGGGNSAGEDALYLAGICSKVYLIHRKDSFKAMSHVLKKIKENNKIEVITPYVVSKINGDKVVSGIEIKNLNEDEKKIIDVDGVFEAIGLIPDNKSFSNLAETDENGYIITDENCNTKTAGIFAAGDTRKKFLRQIITSASDGAIAAQKAFELLMS